MPTQLIHRSYLGLNSFLNLLNRWALGLHGLRFPLIMTASHMIFGFGAFSPLMLMSEKYYSQHTRVLTEDWKGLATIAVMNGVQIACNNASLTVMELSMNQVIRASIPVLVALIAVCVEHKIPSKSEIACLFVISLGVMLAVWEESRNAVLGIILTVSDRAQFCGAQFVAARNSRRNSADATPCLAIALQVASSVMQSIQMSVTGKVMSGKSKLNSFQMTFYTGPVAFMTLLVPAMALEQVVFAEALATKPLATVGFLLGSCCVAVVYNVVLFQSVHTLSSVGTAILGNVKIVCLLFLSSLILGELKGWAANQFLGCFLTFGAAWAYSYIKVMQKKRPPPVLPTAEQVAVRPELSTVSQQLATKDVADATKAAGASGQ
jgi:drug/metabolite transporter (DMT)-like permease